MKDNLQLDKLEDEIDDIIEEAVGEIMELGKEKLEEKTPEDKKDLVQ